MGWDSGGVLTVVFPAPMMSCWHVDLCKVQGLGIKSEGFRLEGLELRV
jgi:hypothetical protein